MFSFLSKTFLLLYLFKSSSFSESVNYENLIVNSPIIAIETSVNSVEKFNISLENLSQITKNIKSIKPSCSCIIPSDHSLLIGVGKKLKINFLYKSNNFVGVTRQSILLNVEGEDKPKCIVVIIHNR